MIKQQQHEDFKHHENITNIIGLTRIADIFANIPCYISGGYPTALLFAPRCKDSPLFIENNYYSDIDIFFQNIEDYYRASNVLKNLPSELGVYVRLESTTDNALTYMIIVRNPEDRTLQMTYTLQLIRKITGTPEQILSTFDIINSSVLYNVHTKEWSMHEKYLSAFINKKLILTNSVPLLDKKNKSYPDSIFFQLERLSKYSTRYDLELDAKSLIRLININKELPDLSFEKNEKVLVRGYYSSYSRFITNTFNVWTAFSNLFVENIYWDKIKNLVSNLDECFPDKEKTESETPIPF